MKLLLIPGLPGMSVWEIGLVVLLALLLFGSRKLPQLARDLGAEDPHDVPRRQGPAQKPADDQDEHRQQGHGAQLRAHFGNRLAPPEAAKIRELPG